MTNYNDLRHMQNSLLYFNHGNKKKKDKKKKKMMYLS